MLLISSWTIDPCNHQIFGPHIQGMDRYEIKSKLDYLVHFLPINYLINTVIPATNNKGKKESARWTDTDLDEMLLFLGLLLAMHVYEIHGPCHLCWSNNDNQLLPSKNFGKIIARCRFEEIPHCLHFSDAENEDQQILDFVAEVNLNFQKFVAPGSFLTVDESMIKSFHHDLKGKIKIIRKQRPARKETKNIFDAFVKTAHRDLPRLLLGEPNLEHGRWVACSTVKDEIKLQACWFKNLKVKDFILTCSTSVPGNPGATRHYGLVNQPQVAESYLKYASSIDIHNHYSNGRCGVEDI